LVHITANALSGLPTIVIPAQAGSMLAHARALDGWIPAGAGITEKD
jgi:hypothetical protein